MTHDMISLLCLPAMSIIQNQPKKELTGGHIAPSVVTPLFFLISTWTKQQKGHFMKLFVNGYVPHSCGPDPEPPPG